MASKMRFISKRRRTSRRFLRYFPGNRKVKDRLFCYIFGQDRKALLQLYNVLNGTDYQDEDALQIVTLDNVLYMSMKNDVAFILMGTLNLYEHQSTVCPNLPLRFLLYIAAEFECYIGLRSQQIYGSTLIRLPAPCCVVFYNGDEEMEDEKILRLTDAFADGQGAVEKSCLELTVRVVNINHGRNRELMAGCRRLEEYSCFVGKMKEFRLLGSSPEEAVEEAAVYCINHGIMEDLLVPFRAEVKKMLLTEYNEKKVMAWLRKEAVEMGRKEGREKGIEEGRKEGREEGREEGLDLKVINQVRKKVARGNSADEIAEMLEENPAFISRICEAIEAHPDWSDERVRKETKQDLYT